MSERENLVLQRLLDEPPGLIKPQVNPEVFATEPTAEEVAAAEVARRTEVDKSSHLSGEDLDSLFGRKAQFVRDFVTLLNTNNGFFGVKLPITKAETKTTSKYFGWKVRTEVTKEPTYIKGYKIGSRDPLHDGQPSSGSVYLCQDAVVREYRGYDSGLLEDLKMGELNIGLEKVTGETYYNRDSRVHDGVNVTRRFIVYSIDDILTKYATEAMTVKLKG